MQRSLKWSRVILLAAIAAALSWGAPARSLAQAAPDNVHWSLSVAPGDKPVAAGSEITVVLSGDIDDGWHIYGLQQKPGGPIALRVTLDPSAAAAAAGEPSESAPEKIQDKTLGMETQYHTHNFTVRLPVRITAADGSTTIPISVRFQQCSAKECRLPRTVHLAAPIEVGPHA